MKPRPFLNVIPNKFNEWGACGYIDPDHYMLVCKVSFGKRSLELMWYIG